MKIEEMIKENRADCVGCHACKNACRFNSIEMNMDAEGFLYPKINHETCKKCGRCDAVCPVLKTKSNPKPDASPATYAMINPDESIRRHSSSGGIFYPIAEKIINDGGVVFGAKFNEDWEVVHDFTDNIAGLRQFQGSKYVQSLIGDMYTRAGDFLKSGRKVLFTGTPCQIAGLKSFLGREYENLLTMDLVCHGVPSPAVWKKYIDFQAHTSGKIHSVLFKRKKPSWGSPAVEIIFKDFPKYTISLGKDYFCYAFLNNFYLRPSCHQCRFRPNGHQQSDLTIGDFWGVERVLPQMFDEKGTSLVLIHTKKGADILNTIKFYVAQSKFSDAVLGNPNLVNSVARHPHRENFFSDFAKGMDIIELLEKYVTSNIGIRYSLERVMPFFGKKFPIFLGESDYFKHVKNLFKIANNDYVNFIDVNKQELHVKKIYDAIRPYAIHIFFTRYYDFLKPYLIQRGLKENEDFVDGRYLFAPVA